MQLTSFAIEKASPKERPYKLSDGRGLSLLVQPNGSKLWRFRYFFAGKENMLAVGPYPEITLASARAKREDARRLIADGIDPSQQRKLDKIAAAVSAANTFGAVADEYIANLKANNAADSTVEKNQWLLHNLAAPISKRPISEVTSAELLFLLKQIERSGRRETARRLRGTMGGVFRLAIVTLRGTNDPTIALRGSLLQPVVTHRAAVTDEAELGALMSAIDEYDGWPAIRAALQFLPLTMTRPGDVRLMRRDEVVFPKALWQIPAERMKMRRPHEVPLSRQALQVLREVWELSYGNEFVFPSIRMITKPLSESAMNVALRRMGYTKDEATAHGFRASASTILNERGFHSDVIEAALAHQDQNDVRRAYNRSLYFKERVALMQTWADLLDEFRIAAPRQTANLRSLCFGK